MGDLGNKNVFAKNLQYYMDLHQISRHELCSVLNFKYSTVSEWLSARKYPRIDKIEVMANYFNIQKSDLIEQNESVPALPSFYPRFSILCSQINLSPTAAIKKIGLSTGNLKNWKYGRIPSTDVLCKIAHFFNVTVDYLLDNDVPENTFTEKEIRLILAYREHPHMQTAVDKLLNLT